MRAVKNKLDSIYDRSKVIPFGQQSKFIIMSDCHRGQGNVGDNFLPNQVLFRGALEYYYKNGFTYIELGDGDELWENRKITPIIDAHSDIFALMSKFYDENRLYMLYGNHDIIKKRKSNTYSHFYCDSQECAMPLFPGIKMTEGLVLRHSESGKDILLVHGHQGSLLNDTFWPVARFLVRYVWSPLELVGFVAPSGSSRPFSEKEQTDKRLSLYAGNSNRIIIAGHTHRPVFPQPGSGLYFNDGCCVHPKRITGIEIENGKLCLIKWSVSVGADIKLYVERIILDGPYGISDYFR